LNSLREEANKLEPKLVEIRMSISHLQNKDKVFILLEGKTDIKLFRNIFSNIYTDTTALDGKDNLMEALRILEQENYSKIIAIKDADFDHLEEVNYPNNLFITDFHDMEVQMIESNALSSIINEFTSNDCHSSLIDNLKNEIYDIAIEISYIRWYSNKQGGLFNFKRIPWNSLISYSNCSISFDKDKLLELLSQQLQGVELNTDNVNLLKEISIDRLQLCNGHDLTILISNYFSIGNINQNKIEEALRLSYHFQDFQNTNLFHNLELWANSNNYILFE